MQEAQENVRLSSQQTSKLTNELNDFRGRLGQSTQEGESYKIRLQKLTGENQALGEEMRGAQENLRLSAGTMTKLQNELKAACNDADCPSSKSSRKLPSVTSPSLRTASLVLSQEIERLNAVLEKKNQELGALNKKLSEIDVMNQTIGGLQSKIN